MKVLYFSQGYTTHDRRFLNRLSDSDHEIWYLKLLNSGDNFDTRSLPSSVHPISWSGIETENSTPETWIRLMPEYTSILDQIAPDCIQAGPVPSCGFMTALAGFHPFILSSWGSDVLVDTDRDKFWTWMIRYTLQHSDALLCDCAAVRSRVHELVSYPDERIISFPWGVDLKRFEESCSTPRWIPPPQWKDSIIVVSTRSWEKAYGIDVVLNSFAKAYQKNSRFRLVMIGGGSLAGEVQQFIQSHQLDDVVMVPGRIPEDFLPDYLRGADLYMSCSHSDGSSISLLEAMAVGLPVIVTDIPSNREWVTPEEHGWLANDGDPEDFCSRLLHAASLDIDSINAIKRNNQGLVRDRADWDRNSNQLMDLYNQLQWKNHHE